MFDTMEEIQSQIDFSCSYSEADHFFHSQVSLASHKLTKTNQHKDTRALQVWSLAAPFVNEKWEHFKVLQLVNLSLK